MLGAGAAQTTDGLGRTTDAHGVIFSKDLSEGQTYDDAGRLFNHRTANDLVTGPRNDFRLHLDAMDAFPTRRADFLPMSAVGASRQRRAAFSVSKILTDASMMRVGRSLASRRRVMRSPLIVCSITHPDARWRAAPPACFFSPAPEDGL